MFYVFDCHIKICSESDRGHHTAITSSPSCVRSKVLNDSPKVCLGDLPAILTAWESHMYLQPAESARLPNLLQALKRWALVSRLVTHTHDGASVAPLSYSANLLLFLYFVALVAFVLVVVGHVTCDRPPFIPAIPLVCLYSFHSIKLLTKNRLALLLSPKSLASHLT